MTRAIPTDSILGLCFALGGAAIFAHALTLAPLPGMNVGPGLFPAIVGAGMALMGAALTIQGWLMRHAAGEEEDAPPLVTWFAVGIVVATAGVTAAMPYLGFLIAGTLYAVVIVLMSGGRWPAALIFSPIATATIYYLFTLALRVPLPRGLLG
jgi:putative tricarboxylic transport membrane protein